MLCAARPLKKQKINNASTRASKTVIRSSSSVPAQSKLSLGTNETLLSKYILPGEHTLTAYSPVCHYFQTGKLNSAAALFWSKYERSQLLGRIQNESLLLKDVIQNGSWDTNVYGPSPELDSPEADLGTTRISSTIPSSSQRIFLRPVLYVPVDGFFEQELNCTSIDTSTTDNTSPSKPDKVEISLSEVAKYKLANYMSFNHYSYFFPRLRHGEWQRTSQLMGNRGTVAVTVTKRMKFRSFIQEYISGSALWKGGQLYATDLIVGTNSIEWQMGKFIPSKSTFKVPSKNSKVANDCAEYQLSVGTGNWPEKHPHMKS
jgi:hypothetical protein